MASNDNISEALQEEVSTLNEYSLETGPAAVQPSLPVMTTPKKGNREAVGDIPQAASPVSSSFYISPADSPHSSTPQASRLFSGVGQPSSAGSTPRISTPRFPVRIGITWKKGEKLEAMDFSRTWYPSKIVEIDEAAKHVLIHFEGWNQRYDEWVAMDSEKLRPVTRHSERKDKGTRKRRIHPHPIYRAGEQVMAKWTDCKKYPAKINRQMEDGAYEVIFYDGVSRLIQPMNIQPMPEEIKNMKMMKVPPATRPKIPFKHIKVSLPESIKRKQEQKLEKHKMSSLGKMMAKRMKKHSPQTPVGDSSDTSPKVNTEQPSVLDQPSMSRPRVSPLRLKMKLKKSSMKSKAKTSAVSETEPVKTLGTVSSTVVTPADTTSQPTPAAAEVSEPVVTAAPTAAPSTAAAPPLPAPVVAKKTVLMKDADTAAASEMQIITAIVEQSTEGAVATQTQTPTVSGRVRPKMFGTKRTKKRASTDLFHPPKRKRAKSSTDTAKAGGLKKRPPALGSGEKSKSLDTGTSIAPPVSCSLPAQVFIPSKAFIVAEDHNPYKCPHEGCNKDFRKENLLAYHIKYYHTEAETPTPPSASATSGESASTVVTSPLLPPSVIHSPGGTPNSRKRRKKTNSVCSTDSDVSVSSKGKSSSKRQRHDSEISVTTASPDLTGKDVWADVKPARLSQDSAAEEPVAADTEDDDVEADVVNCVCGQRETNGLMIQCELCMCWQHFSCVDAKNTGVPPANYVCLICENPRGIRDSCRHQCDMGWERRGELPSFPFASENTAQHLKSIAVECNYLTSVLNGIKSTLHSTRRQIKISKEDGDPEFQLWQTDWDNWTKPEEDLTLTPRSVDPDPSPTPSTFLFPSAPQLNTTTSANSIATVVLSPSASLSSLHSSSSSLPSITTSATGFTATSHSSLSSQHTAPHPISSTTMTTTTIEISMMPESSLVVSQSGATQPEESSSCNVTPPSGSSHFAFHSPPTTGNTSVPAPQAPSVDRGGSLPSIQGRAGNIVKDLFPSSSGESIRSSSISLYDDSTGKKIQINGNTQRQEGLPSTGTRHLSAESASNELNKLSGHFSSGQTQQQGAALSASQPQETLSSSSSSHQEKSKESVDSSQQNSLSSTSATSGSLSAHQQSEQGRQAQTVSDTVTNDTSTISQNLTSESSAAGGHSIGMESTNSPASYSEGHSGSGQVAKHMTSLYVDVNGRQGQVGGYNDDDQDNDTDTAEESVDPYKNCEHNLLVHVSKVHSDIETQLELLEQRITELENSEHTNPTVQLSEDNVLNDLPALKKSLGKLSRNLVKVQRLCIHH